MEKTAESNAKRNLGRPALGWAMIVTILAGLYILDATTDIISCALHIPAMRAGNSPASQDGFELVSISRSPVGNLNIATDNGTKTVGLLPSYGDTIMALRCDWTPKVLDVRNGWYGIFTAYGRSSTGSKFDLRVESDDVGNDNDRYPPVLAIIVPGSYPPAYKWIDVTVKSTDGHRATWRITRLPRTHQALPERPLLAPGVSIPDKTIVSYAVHSFSSESLAVCCGYPKEPFAVKPGDYWQITPSRGNAQMQWETRDMALHRRSVNPTLDDDGATWKFDHGSHGEGIWDNAESPYPEDRYVRTFCDVAHVATLTEKVTFHDIPIRRSGFEPGVPHDTNDSFELNPSKPLTATTPSGITLRLSAPAPGEARTGGVLTAILTVFPQPSWGDWYRGGEFSFLNKSVLCHRLGRPVQVSVTMLGYDAEGWEGDTVGGPVHVDFIPERFTGRNALVQLGPLLKNVTFVITQRAMIQRTPISFTLDRTKIPVERRPW